ncbi:MAG: hypothetical protein ACM3L6_02825 [Deltaproteobacteria bacterium]
MKAIYRFVSVVCFLLMAVPAARAEQVRSSFLYDETDDSLTVRLWLEREGVVIRNTSSDKFGPATLEIYDEVTNGWLPEQTLEPPESSDLTTHIFSWKLDKATTNTKGIRLGKGKTYFARCTMRYGGPSGTGFTYQTGATFTMAVTSPLHDVAASAASLRSKLAGIKDAVDEESSLTREVVQRKTEGALVAPEAHLPGEGALSPETSEEASLEGAAQVQVDERSVLLGSIVTVRFHTYPDVVPVVTVYDPERVVRVATARMVQYEKGNYRYSLRLDPGWPTGDYTVVCSEASHGTMSTLTLTAKRPTLAALGAVAPPGSAGAQEAPPAAQAVATGMQAAQERLERAADAVERMRQGTGATSEVAEYLASLYNNLKELGERVKEMGFDPAGLSEVSEERARDFEYLRNKAQEIKALYEINMRLLEPVAQDEPIIQVWMEFS